MTTTERWHVPADELGRYASGGARSFEIASVEAHLVACASCCAALAVVRASMTTGDSASDASWSRIVDRIDQPRRVLRMGTSTLQLCLASPPLVAATLGLASTLLVLIGILTVVDAPQSLPVLLALAPLAPVAGAVLAYQPEADPAGAMAPATPLAAGRLLFLRAMMASVVTLVAGLAASAVAPLSAEALLLWLLPGLALTAIVLALGTWINPTGLALVLAGGWVALIVSWWTRHRAVPEQAALADFATDPQAVRLVCIAIAVIAAAICHLRRDARPNWRTR